MIMHGCVSFKQFSKEFPNFGKFSECFAKVVRTFDDHFLKISEEEYCDYRPTLFSSFDINITLILTLILVR